MRADQHFWTVGHHGELKSDPAKCFLLLPEPILSPIVTVPLLFSFLLAGQLFLYAKAINVGSSY